MAVNCGALCGYPLTTLKDTRRMVQLTDIPLSESLTSGLHSIAHTISASTTYIQSHEGQEAELA